MSCCVSLRSKIANLIRAFSIGKYNHGLYYKGESHQSSIFGGLTTFFSLTILLSFVTLVF